MKNAAENFYEILAKIALENNKIGTYVGIPRYLQNLKVQKYIVKFYVGFWEEL